MYLIIFRSWHAEYCRISKLKKHSLRHKVVLLGRTRAHRTFPSRSIRLLRTKYIYAPIGSHLFVLAYHMACEPEVEQPVFSRFSGPCIVPLFTRLTQSASLGQPEI